MGQSKSKANQNTVVIRMTSGVFYGLILAVVGVIAVGAVFWVGLKLGSGRDAAARQPAYYPSQPSIGQPVAPQQPAAAAQPQVETSNVPPQTEARRPAGSEIPIGDNPRLAIPELAASNYVLDFGETPLAEGPVTKEVTIKNTGVKELDITDVSANCSCTTAYVEPREVPPGGETTLTVTHDTEVMLGHGSTNIAHQILIGSNDPAAPWVAIDTAGTATE